MVQRYFSIKGTKNLTVGASHTDVRLLQQYLRRFGYLTDASSTDGTLDQATSEAVKRYQTFFGLDPTGIVNEATASSMESPRCGNPDLRPPGLQSRLISSGCSYWGTRRILTYGFANATPDIPGDGEREAVRRAFRTWQAVAWVDFVEVPIENGPDLRMQWQSKDHGDGTPFDGVGRVLAHAFYPPPCGGKHAGQCHADEDEVWGLDHGVPQGAIDLETVLLHEIGHLLGLDHSSNQNSVMAPNYPGRNYRVLQADDIARIEALYGRRGPAMRVRVHLEGFGDLAGLENQYLGTRGESRRIEGFQLEISGAVPGLTVEYMGHIEGFGDTPFQSEGTWCGTRSEYRRLEGLAIRLAGPAASQYDVRYTAHIEGYGDSPLKQNGEFVGSRGESRRLEGLLVRIEPRR